MHPPLLQLSNVTISFGDPELRTLAVDTVALAVSNSQTVALVGESGCGKSVTALSIMRLLPIPPARIVSGEVLFHDSQCAGKPKGSHSSPRSRPEPDTGGQAASGVGRDSTIDNRQLTISGSRGLKPAAREPGPVDLLKLSEREMRRIRGGRIAMIFQEPLTSLNPVFTVGAQIVEAIELHQPLRGRDARDRAVELLARVGIQAPEQRVHDYPHRLSGGMRQRVMIAMALACEPALLIADEPTTALDVTTQAQILDLLRDIQAETGMSVLIITHDLGVVAEIADHTYVMYAGRIVEHAATRDLFADPLHPYTRGLIRCTPRLGRRTRQLEVIPGTVPDASDPPGGCRFHPRCDLSVERARFAGRERVPHGSEGVSVLRRCVERHDREPSGTPVLRELRPNHFAACWEA